MNAIRTMLGESSSLRRVVFKNASWRFLASGVAKITRFVVVFLAARWLGPETFGQYNYALSLASLAFIFSDWGINALLIRDINQGKPSSEAVSASIITKVLVNTVSALIALLVFYFVDGGAYFGLGLLLSLLLILSNIREIYINFFIAKKNNRLEFYATLVEIVVSILLLVGMKHLFFGTATHFAFFNIFVVFLTLVVSVWIAHRVLAFHWTAVSRSAVIDLLKSGLPLALFGISGYIFFASDQLFIKHYLGFESVGYYSLATRVITAAQLVPAILVSVLFPFLSSFAHTERERFQKLLGKGSAVMAMSAVAALAFVFLFARPLIAFLAPEYLIVLPFVKIMSIAFIATFISVLLDNALLALNKQKQNLFITLSAASLNLLLNFLFIPNYGIMGAIYATLISQYVNMLATYGFLWSTLCRKKI